MMYGVPHSFTYHFLHRSKQLSFSCVNMDCPLHTLTYMYMYLQTSLSRPPTSIPTTPHSPHPPQMRRLNGSTTLLNQSLSDIQSMRNKMASMGSVMESYDSQLKDLHRDLGDLSAEQTELEEKVGGLSEGLTDVQVGDRSLQNLYSNQRPEPKYVTACCGQGYI